MEAISTLSQNFTFWWWEYITRPHESRKIDLFHAGPLSTESILAEADICCIIIHVQWTNFIFHPFFSTISGLCIICTRVGEKSWRKVNIILILIQLKNIYLLWNLDCASHLSSLKIQEGYKVIYSSEVV